MGLRPGQLDPQTSEIGHRMRELAGRKAYLRNFWYAAGGCIRYPILPQGLAVLRELPCCAMSYCNLACSLVKLLEEASPDCCKVVLPKASGYKHGKNWLDCCMRGFFRAGMACAGISEQVKDKPVGVEILGEKVVLYRDSTGTIQCLHDVCPHRGAPLHKVCLFEQPALTCSHPVRLHGWAV